MSYARRHSTNVCPGNRVRYSLAPGRYFRLLLVGYFEGIDSERGIAWRAADSLAVRSFLRLGLEEAAPDHSTISRTRRVIDVETHRAVFTWVQQRLAAAGLLKDRTIAIDATTLEANAAMRSIVRRETGEAYQAYLTRLAAASGIKTPTREVLARFDRKRKKKTSNREWTSPSDPDAKVAKMKDGQTHLAHKAEHAVDLESGALVAVTVQGADQGDTRTLVTTAITAAEQVEAAHATTDARGRLEDIVADKGSHSNETMVDLAAVGLRSYISEPDRGRRDWSDAPDDENFKRPRPPVQSGAVNKGVIWSRQNGNLRLDIEGKPRLWFRCGNYLRAEVVDAHAEQAHRPRSNLCLVKQPQRARHNGIGIACRGVAVASRDRREVVVPHFDGQSPRIHLVTQEPRGRVGSHRAGRVANVVEVRHVIGEGTFAP